jgi:nucleoside-diphosphate-sugar epimerase
MRSIIVTGANGFVGGTVTRQLVTGHRNCAGLVRAERVSEPAGAPMRTLTAWTADALAPALRGFEAVIHSASVVHRPGAPLDEYERFNREGTRSLVDACHQAGVRRLVFLSSIKVYGEEPPGTIDESTPVAPDPGYAATKLDAERIVLEAAKSHGVSGIVLRLCPVFGRGDKGNVRTVIQAIDRRRFFVPGDGNTRKSLVHVDAVARAAITAADRDDEGVFVVADPVAPTMRELADAIARALGRPRPRSLPVPAMYAAATMAEWAGKLLRRRPPATRALVRKSLIPTICSPAAIQSKLGVDCHVDLDWAMRDEVAWLRSAGLLR